MRGMNKPGGIRGTAWRRWVVSAAAMAMVAGPAQATAWAAAPPPPALSASAAILVDGSTGQILYGHDIRGEYYPASITKIMTAYLAIRYGWNKTVSVSTAAQNQTGSSCYLRAGERDPMAAVVTAMMLVSGNDAAWAVAQTVSGRVPAFVDLMNRTARAWHAPGIHFANPSGLPDPRHVVSALGMAVIAEHAMANPIFRRIVATRTSSLPPDPAPRIYYNQNRLLYTYPGAVGIKIGYTIEADETIVGAARRHGVFLIEVLLHDTPAGLWPDAANLLSWGFDNFQAVTAVARGRSLGSVIIGGRRVPVRAARTAIYLAYRHQQIRVRWRVVAKKPLGNRYIAPGTLVGQAAVFVNGRYVTTVPVAAGAAVAPLPPPIRWDWRWLGGGVALSLLYAAVVRPRRRSVGQSGLRGRSGL